VKRNAIQNRSDGKSPACWVQPMRVEKVERKTMQRVAEEGDRKADAPHGQRLAILKRLFNRLTL
jgi:hypothetical protein